MTQKISKSLIQLASDGNVIQLDIVRLIKEGKLNEEQIKDILDTIIKYFEDLDSH